MRALLSFNHVFRLAFFKRHVYPTSPNGWVKLQKREREHYK
jgi:hypothetical protein